VIGRLMIILLSVAIYLVGIIPALAQGDYPYTWTSAPESAYKGEHRWNWATPQDYEKVTGKRIEKYNESPLLRAKVAAGELPPVEERLPEEPLVVNPYEEIGEYGGIAHVACPSTRWVGDGLHLNNAEAPLRPDVGLHLDSARPRPNIPNVVKDWKLSNDYRSITLYMRKGMRWSDGEAFTADDIVFWYEDVLLNEEFTPAIDSRWIIGGEVWKLKKINDYTIRLEFAAPFPFVLYNLATWGPEVMTSYPKHYLGQFHPRYADKEKLEKMVKKEGFDHWYELFAERSLSCWGGTSDVPTLSPYMLKGKSITTITMERNPYYWKVDTQGNQLPYFDGISAKVVTDAEIKESMTITGEFDFSWGCSTANYPMFMENAEKGNYRVLLYPYANRAGRLCISINQTYNKDLVLRKIFRDKKFRQALSVAIEREEMNEVLYHGRGRPMPSTVLPCSMFYLPEFDKAYTEYDPEKADALLDEMDLNWDENHKYRLRPDGKRLSLILDAVPGIEEGADSIATAEMLVKYWRTIGINIVVKSESGDLFEARVLGNEHQLSLGGGSTTTDDNLIMAPHHYVLWHMWSDAGYGPLWVTWYLTKGERGERPPEDLIEVTKKWEKILVTVDEQERVRLGREIFRWNAENILTIGLVGMLPGPEIVRVNLRNIPPTGLDGGIAGTALIDYYWPEQFFFRAPLFEGQKRY